MKYFKARALSFEFLLHAKINRCKFSREYANPWKIRKNLWRRKLRVERNRKLRASDAFGHSMDWIASDTEAPNQTCKEENAYRDNRIFLRICQTRL
jgi:hypothetical protein